MDNKSITPGLFLPHDVGLNQTSTRVQIPGTRQDSQLTLNPSGEILFQFYILFTCLC
jgi:hypothetical protein